MKTIVNKTSSPIRVPLPRGKVLHLGPRASAQISHKDIDHEPFKKLVEAGSLEIQESVQRARGGHDHSRGPHESTHGFHPPGSQQGKGDR
jgi:hypothetical protein